MALSVALIGGRTEKSMMIGTLAAHAAATQSVEIDSTGTRQPGNPELEIGQCPLEESNRRRMKQVARLSICPASASPRVRPFEDDSQPIAGEDDVPVDRFRTT